MRSAAKWTGLSQKTIGQAMGRSPSTVSNWWNGRSSPTVAEVERYAEITGSPAVWLLAGDLPEGEENDPDEQEEIQELAPSGQETAESTPSGESRRQDWMRLAGQVWDMLSEERRWELLFRVAEEALALAREG